MTLNDVGFENVALHAMIPQAQRLAALAKFKSNTVKMLIATDVASRGLDIPAVQLVLNHTVPRVPKEYIHRVGRTARAGRGGKAITLVTPYDIDALKAIEKLINTKLTEYKIDGKRLFFIKSNNCYFINIFSVSDKEVGKIYTQVSVTESEAYIKLDEKDFFEKKMVNKRKQWILEGLDPDEEEEKYINKRKKFKKGKRQKKKKKDILQNTEVDVSETEIKQ